MRAPPERLDGLVNVVGRFPVKPIAAAAITGAILPVDGGYTAQ